MAHELAFFTDGRARIAYVGATPWHGLGQQLTEGAPIEVWAKEAGMDFQILGSPVGYKTTTGKTFAYGKKQVLYRGDTEEALAVVGERYRVVQPIEVLDFFRNLVADQGFQLETAGVLFNGSKYWALARMGEDVRIKGQDVIRPYLMLGTACDGSMQTTAKLVETRVVCNNTIEMAMAEGQGAVKVRHSSKFDAAEVQKELGLAPEVWKSHVEQVKALADRKVSNKEAVEYVVRMFGDEAKSLEAQPNMNTIARVLQLFDGQSLGSELKSANGTAWGLVNAVTQAVDWHKGKSQDHRLASAWFYDGGRLKQQAFQQAVNDFVLAKAA